MAVTRARSGELGVVYTPREVCEPMVRRALAPLIAGRTAEQILELRICDPAIGEGAFLIEIVRVLAEAVAATIGADAVDARRLVAERCIHGVDIDARAVVAARAAVEDFVGEQLPALADHLRVADALACAWSCALDAVIGNPPYIRQERIGDGKHALRSFASYDGVADLYVYFIELAHRIVRRGGRYCLIVPNKWMTAAYGRPLREFLAREASVEGVVDFERALFAGVDAFPCIVWGTTGADAPAIRAVRTGGSVAAALSDTSANQPRVRWRSGPWHIDADRDAALLDRLAKRWPPLGEVVPERPSRGIVTGCNRAFVINPETRDRLLAAEPAAAALIRPFLKGRDVRRWRPAPIERSILLVDRGTSLAALPHVRAHLEQFRDALEPRPRTQPAPWPGRKPGSYHWYELQDPVVPLAKTRSPRLFYQDIQTAPACCIDPSGELVPDTTVWILPSADLVLLAVLNSRLYAWYAARRFPPALNGAVRPKLDYMRRLPIATPSPALRTRIEALVTAQLAGADPSRDAELDVAICDSYELSPSERKLIASGSTYSPSRSGA